MTQLCDKVGTTTKILCNNGKFKIFDSENQKNLKILKKVKTRKNGVVNSSQKKNFMIFPFRLFLSGPKGPTYQKKKTF